MNKKGGLRFAAALLLALLATGCAHYGSVTRGAIEGRLTPNVSSKADVLKVLGPPRGYGMARLGNAEQRSLWYYEEGGSAFFSLRLSLVLVAFRGETYEGFLSLDAEEHLHSAGGAGR